MTNSKIIKRQILTVHILRGILIGLIILAAAVAVLSRLSMIGFSTGTVIADVVGTIVFFALIGAVTGALKGRRVMRPILRQDKLYAGTHFDREHFHEAAGSGNFYLGDDWLLYHRDLVTKAWNRNSIDLIERTGAKSSGNKVGMMKLVSGKDEYMMTYQVSDTDLEQVLQHWLNPVTEPQTKICPACGTVNAPEAHFCAECGADLDPEQSI